MPEIKNKYDVLIVGAGLSGTATALHLSKTDKTICLIDKKDKPHHKVCGEFLSHEAVSYLNDLGLDVKTLGAVKIDKMRLIKESVIVEANLPFDAYSVSRYLLDEALLDLAIKAGVTVKRGITINSITNNDNWKASSGDFAAIGESLFLATGKHDIKGWGRPDGVKNDYIGFKMHYKLSAPACDLLKEYTEIIMFDGGYAGLQLIEDNQANLCFLVEKEKFKSFKSDWNVFIKDLINQTPRLRNVLNESQPCWNKPLAIFNIPYGFVFEDAKVTMSNIYRLGDQMAVIPSFAGGGMAIALHTAKLAADSYLNGDADYNIKSLVSLRWHICKSTYLGRIIGFSKGQSLIIKIVKFNPSILTKIAKYTRLAS